MREAKRQRIEAKGWKVGSTAEFLELTPAEAQFIEVKLLLSRWLRVVRQNQALTQQALARLLHSSQSRVAKMESGDPSVSLDLLVRALVALGATADDLARVLSGQTPTSPSRTGEGSRPRQQRPSERSSRSPQRRNRAA